MKIPLNGLHKWSTPGYLFTEYISKYVCVWFINLQLLFLFLLLKFTNDCGSYIQKPETNKIITTISIVWIVTLFFHLVCFDWRIYIQWMLFWAQSELTRSCEDECITICEWVVQSSQHAKSMCKPAHKFTRDCVCVNHRMWEVYICLYSWRLYLQCVFFLNWLEGDVWLYGWI